MCKFIFIFQSMLLSKRVPDCKHNHLSFMEWTAINLMIFRVAEHLTCSLEMSRLHANISVFVNDLPAHSVTLSIHSFFCPPLVESQWNWLLDLVMCRDHFNFLFFMEVTSLSNRPVPLFMVFFTASFIRQSMSETPRIVR